MKRTIQGMELEVWLSGIFSPVRTSDLCLFPSAVHVCRRAALNASDPLNAHWQWNMM
jgi:hypothetical protein